MNQTPRNSEHEKNKVDNKTKQAITSFERFVFPEWPLEINDEPLPLSVLCLQLLYGRGFCLGMKLIDLSTPANIRFDIKDVLNLLQDKMRHCTLKSIEKLVLPHCRRHG